MINYTDEELMIFYTFFDDDLHTSFDAHTSFAYFKYRIVTNRVGAFYKACEIPYEELPLHINDSNSWYAGCIKIRLIIGK